MQCAYTFWKQHLIGDYQALSHEDSDIQYVTGGVSVLHNLLSWAFSIFNYYNIMVSIVVAENT